MSRFRDTPSMAKPWKNGNGLTQEFASAMDGDALLWRLSLADIDRDGAFSTFPGMSRILTLISGNGITLTGPQANLSARPRRPLHFEGAFALDAALIDGSCRAFNLIYDPMRIIVQAKVANTTEMPPMHGAGACFVLKGEVSLGQEGTLTKSEGATRQPNDPTWNFHGNGQFLCLSWREC